MATAFKQAKDNAVSTTSTSFASTGVTSTTAATGTGALFPQPGNGFYMTIWTGSAGSDPGADANVEIVTVTARSTDVLTHSATTKTHSAPVNIALTSNAEYVSDIQTAVNGIENATTTLAGVLATGGTGVANVVDVSGDTYPPFRTTRNNSGTTTSFTAFSVKSKTSATIANGFGVDFDFLIEGNGQAQIPIALIRAVKSGGTAQSGTLRFVTYNNGVQTEQATISETGDMQLANPGTATNSVVVKSYVDNKATSSSFIVNEVPGGLVNSSNTAYTTASNMATGSLRVHRNGIRLKGGGVDFTQGSNNAFTMVTAPITGDALLVDYNVSSTGFTVGTNSTISTQAPTGLVNGSNTSFTVGQGVYIAGSLEVYIDGIHQARGVDYTETTPASGIFTMTTAPATGQTIYCNYQFNLNPSSNADTVDGIHANSTATAGQLYPLNSSARFPSSLLEFLVAVPGVGSPSGNPTTISGLQIKRGSVNISVSAANTDYTNVDTGIAKFTNGVIAYGINLAAPNSSWSCLIRGYDDINQGATNLIMGNVHIDSSVAQTITVRWWAIGY